MNHLHGNDGCLFNFKKVKDERRDRWQARASLLGWKRSFLWVVWGGVLRCWSIFVMGAAAAAAAGGSSRNLGGLFELLK